jgi:adenylate cyclase class IV
MTNTYEYEERAFLTEEDFFRVKELLEKQSLTRALDNKLSYFFVLPKQNLSIAQSEKKCVIKYKHGTPGIGNGFSEFEIPVDTKDCEQTIGMFKLLLGIEPHLSEQFRINYVLKNNIEVALKYTETWGFHLEIEKTYSEDTDLPLAKQEVEKIANELKIHLITDPEMKAFRANFDASGKPKGEYSSEQFRQKFGNLF